MKVYNGSSNESNRAPSYKIYVAGVPSGEGAFDLELYFALFGTVLNVRRVGRKLVKSYKSRTAPDTDRDKIAGSCCVEVADLASYNSILSHYPHSWKGRVLHCSPYLKASSAKMMSEHNNRRRIFAKRVPICVSDEEIIGYLENNFGIVDHFFVLKTELHSSRVMKEERKYKTYSIFFKDEEVAKVAASHSPITIKDGISIVLEIFSMDKIGQRGTTSTTKNESSATVKSVQAKEALESNKVAKKNPTYSAKAKRTVEMEKTESEICPQSHYRHSNVKSSSCGPSGKLDFPSKSSVFSEKALHSEYSVGPRLSSSLERVACQRPQATLLESILHRTRPTSMKYQFIRWQPKVLGAGEGNFQSANPTQTNMRINRRSATNPQAFGSKHND